jgi:hypothetical protein
MMPSNFPIAGNFPNLFEAAERVLLGRELVPAIGGTVDRVFR